MAELGGQRDAVLVKRTRRGDRAAFGVLVKKYQDLVCAIAYSRLGDIDSAQDVAQEAFLVSLENLSRLRPASKFRSWLRGITHKLCNQWQRAEAYRRALREELQHRPAKLGSTAPPEVLETTEDRNMVRQAIKELPLGFREAIVLHYLQGQSLAETARSLGIGKAAATKRVQRARSKIRRYLIYRMESEFKRLRLDEDFSQRLLAAVPVGSVLSRLGLRVTGRGFAEIAQMPIRLAARHAPTIPSEEVMMMTRRGIITAAAIALTIAVGGGTGYLALKHHRVITGGAAPPITTVEEKSGVTGPGHAESEGAGPARPSGSLAAGQVGSANTTAIDPEGRLAAARELISRGEYREAIAMLAGIVEGFGGTDECAQAHVLIGVCLRELGEPEAALVHFNTVIAEYAGSSAAGEAAKAFAVLHSKAESITDGMEWVLSLLDADPNNVAAKKAWWSLVELAARSADPEELLELLEICKEGLEQDKESVDAQLALAWAMKRVDRGKALQLLAQIAQDASDPSVVAEALLRQATLTWWEDLDRSIGFLERALSSPADESIKRQARLKLAAWYAKEDIAKAALMFEQALSDGWTQKELQACLTEMVANAIKGEADVDYLVSWLAAMTGGRGEMSESAMLLRAFLENPTSADAVNALPVDTLQKIAAAYMVKGDPMTARRLCEASMQHMEDEGIQSDESYVAVLRAAALASFLERDFAGAARLLEEAIAAFPDHEDVAQMLAQRGFYLNAMNRADEALAELQRVVDEYPDSAQVPQALMGMVSVYARLGDLEGMRSTAQRVLDEYPLTHHAKQAQDTIDTIDVIEGKKPPDPENLQGDRTSSGSIVSTGSDGTTTFGVPVEVQQLIQKAEYHLEVREREGGGKDYHYRFKLANGEEFKLASPVPLSEVDPGTLSGQPQNQR